MTRLGAVVGVAALPLITGPKPAGADTGVVFYKKLEFNNGSFTNACYQVFTPFSSDLVTVHGHAEAYATTYNSGSNACSGSVSGLPANYFYAYSYLYDNGTICDGGGIGNSAGLSRVTAQHSCYLNFGDSYYTSGKTAWYKGQYCTSNDHCNSNGFTSSSVVNTNTVSWD